MAARAPGRAHRALAVLLALVLCGLFAAARESSAHTGHLVEPVVVEDFGYQPALVTISAGSTVAWQWKNSIPHSVTSGLDSDEKFDSGMRVEGDRSFAYRFDVPGTYRYHSESGLQSISGTIEVQPIPGSGPEIKRLKVAGKKKPKAKFMLSKNADLVGRVEERKKGKWRTRHSFSRRLKAGTNRIKIPRRGLATGRYRLELRAYDRQSRDTTAKVKFRFR